jgi:acetyl esterase/lipase
MFGRTIGGFRMDRLLAGFALQAVIATAVGAVLTTLGVYAAQGGGEARAEAPIRLWQGDAPGALGHDDKDTPTLTPYLPDPGARNGTAVVICPGGGYGMLADHEGRDYALFLNKYGVSAFVLKYRLGSNGYRHPRMLEDAARAVRTVRARAKEWGVDAQRVGIMGSSAGGHLASTLLTHFDAGAASSADAVERESSRPDFGILCYAVISLGPHGHAGSRTNLLGPNPPAELVELLSNERQVTAQTPPCFIWHTLEDDAVPVENSIEFAAALRRNGVPFDLHVYQNGRHGIGLADKPPFEHAHPWGADLVYWMRVRGYVR